MVLTKAQSQIASDTHRFRVVNCGRRFGKTQLTVLEMVAVAASKSDQRVCYIASTYQQARDIAWNELKRFAGPIIQSVNESRLEIILRAQGGGTSKIILRGWESVDTLRGQRFDLLALDEVSSYRNFWVGWGEVLSPTLIDTKGSAIFISTPKGFNHFYDLFNLQDTDPDFKSFHFTTYDNPHIPVDEIEREKRAKPENVFAQEYMADFRKTEGLVYKEFDRDIHTFDSLTPLPRFEETILGIDFGFTNPCCILVIKCDYDNRYWVTEEWYKTKQGRAQIVEKALSFGSSAVYPDPEDAGAVAELQEGGLNVREVTKGKGSVARGIDVVREMFKSRRIFVSKKCVNLISELESYHYPDSNPEKNAAEDPVKKNDHALDALRYALVTHSPNIEETQDQDFGLYSRQNYG